MQCRTRCRSTNSTHTDGQAQNRIRCRRHQKGNNKAGRLSEQAWPQNTALDAQGRHRMAGSPQLRDCRSLPGVGYRVIGAVALSAAHSSSSLALALRGAEGIGTEGIGTEGEASATPASATLAMRVTPASATLTMRVNHAVRGCRCKLTAILGSPINHILPARMHPEY